MSSTPSTHESSRYRLSNPGSSSYPFTAAGAYARRNDFFPLNVAFVEGLPVSAFDFDQAAPGPRTHDLAYAAWLWLLGADIAGHLESQLALLRTFLDGYGLEDEHRRGFGGRIVARVEAERDFHERAGRVAAPGSWLHNEIAWLRGHADAIDRGLESSS